MQTIRGFDLRWCEDLLGKLFKIPISAPFLKPSATSDIGLHLIRYRLRSNKYEHVPHLLSDLKLIYTNTLSNARENAILVAMASDLWNLAAEQFAVKSKCPSEEWLKEVFRTATKLDSLTRNPVPGAWHCTATQLPPTFFE
jgi:hypothetical protein